MFSAATVTFPRWCCWDTSLTQLGCGNRESTAVLALHWCQSPAVTATLCLSFPHCSQGDAVTWHTGLAASASPQHLETSRKSQDFPPIQAGVWQYPITAWTVLGEVGGSSGEGSVQMLTWGSKSVMSHRCHAGLRLGNLQSLSFLAHTFGSAEACGTEDAPFWQSHMFYTPALAHLAPWSFGFLLCPPHFFDPMGFFELSFF